MSATVYSMAPLDINGTILPVESIGLPHDILSVLYQHSGNEYPSLVAVPGANARVTFRSPFAAAYPVIGFTCLRATTLNFYLAKFATLIRAAGSVHPKLPLASSASALVVQTGWSVNQDGILMGDYECVYLSADMTTHPIGALTTNNALPSLASQPALHTLGPMSVNGTVYGGLMSSSGNLGQVYEARRTDGGPYPMVAARYGGTPSLSGEHSDPISLWSVMSPTGAAISANVVQYYRAYDPTTGLVSSTNSVSITCAAGRVHPQTITTGQGKVATVGIEVLATSATATHPFAVSLAATAPAVP